MKLHEIESLFYDAVVAASQHFNIQEIFIEKDYWVTVALYSIFHSEIRDQAVFKGGTALSKCYKIIDRFSEDVDIVVLNNEGDSANALKNKLKAITNTVASVMPEIELEGVTNKMGMIRKTAHEYKKMSFGGKYGQVREHIIVEATWLGSSNPYEIGQVSCYITDMMKAKGQSELIEEYNMGPFDVKVLSLSRTLCEKIMSLVRFSHTEDPINDLSNKIRHIYDINQMLRHKQISDFFNSEEFDKMLMIVGNDDVASFRNNNKWLANHPSEAIIFKDADTTWGKIRGPYTTTFKDLIIGTLPDEKELIETLKVVKKRLDKVNWDIQIE